MDDFQWFILDTITRYSNFLPPTLRSTRHCVCAEVETRNPGTCRSLEDSDFPRNVGKNLNIEYKEINGVMGKSQRERQCVGVLYINSADSRHPWMNTKTSGESCDGTVF